MIQASIDVVSRTRSGEATVVSSAVLDAADLHDLAQGCVIEAENAGWSCPEGARGAVVGAVVAQLVEHAELAELTGGVC